MTKKLYKISSAATNNHRGSTTARDWIVDLYGNKYDFSCYVPLGEVAEYIFYDFYAWATLQSKETFQNKARDLFRFFDWLILQPPAYHALSTQTLLLYADFLDTKGLAETTSYGRYQSLANSARRLIDVGKISPFRIPKRFEEGSVGRKRIQTLSGLLPGGSTCSTDNKTLLGQLLSFCWQKVDHKLKQCDLGRHWVDRPHCLDTKELSSLVHYIGIHFNGVPELGRRSGHMSIYNNCLYREVLALHGGAANVVRYFGPDCEDLIPFGVIFSAAIINPESILKILVTNLRDTERPGWKALDWEKPRAGGEVDGLSWPVGGTSAKTVPRAFMALQEVTRQFRTSSQDKEHLFLAWGAKPTKGSGRDCYVANPTSSNFSANLIKFRTKFLQAHPEWCDDDGNGPVFSFNNIRATAINVLHSDLGQDLEGTRIGARHKSRRTTALYLGEAEQTDARVAHVRASQDMMLGWVRENTVNVIAPTTDAVALAIGSSTEAAKLWLEKGKNAVGNGFQCKNPLKSPMPGQVEGRLCTFFIGCFSCSNNIVIATALNAARMILWKEHIEASEPDMVATSMPRWLLIYKPQLVVLYEALHDMPPEIFREGRRIAKQLRIVFPTIQ